MGLESCVWVSTRFVQRSLCSSIMGSEVSSRHEFATSLSSLAQRGRWSRVGVVSLSRGSLIRSYVAELAWLVQANFRVSKTLTLFVAKSTVYLAFIADRRAHMRSSSINHTWQRNAVYISVPGMQCMLCCDCGSRGASLFKNSLLGQQTLVLMQRWCCRSCLWMFDIIGIARWHHMMS